MTKRIVHKLVRPVCKCGGYAILGDKCADCYKASKGEAMTEQHVHEWYLLRNGTPCCSDGNCGAVMVPKETIRRLNATERLSAEFRTWAENIDPKHSPQIERELFTEWANILEAREQ